MTTLVLEADVYYSAFGDDPDLGELVEMFVDEMPDRIHTLRTAFDTGNLEELKRTAHQLKGASGSYGFDQVTPYAALVEYSVRDGKPSEDIRAAVDKLVDLCQRLRAGTP